MGLLETTINYSAYVCYLSQTIYYFYYRESVIYGWNQEPIYCAKYGSVGSVCDLKQSYCVLGIVGLMFQNMPSFIHVYTQHWLNYICYAKIHVHILYACKFIHVIPCTMYIHMYCVCSHCPDDGELFKFSP